MLSVFPAINGLAFSFSYDGLSYNTTGSKTVEVARNYSSNIKGDITVPSEVSYNNKTYTVTEVGNYAFGWCDKLTSITLPNTITRMGYEVFISCTGLTSFTMPNSVVTIGASMFESCVNLKNVTLSDNLNSLTANLFHNCGLLSEITIPEKVSTIRINAFANCTSLTQVTIPDGVTEINETVFANDSNLTSVTIGSKVAILGSGVFSNCPKLKNVTFNSLDNLKSLGSSAFNGCKSLVSIVLPNSLTTLDVGTFYNCTSLESITLPNSLTKINTNFYNNEEAFGNCVSLKTVELPATLQSIGGFYNCTSLTDITFPDGLVSIYGFRNCTALKALSIPASVTLIYGNTFDGCTGVETATVDSDNKKYDSRDNCNCIIETATNGVIFACKNSVIPNSVNSIFSFGGNQELTVHIPSSVSYIANGAFRYCGGIVVEDGNATYDSRDNCNAVIETAKNTIISGCVNTTIPSSVTSIGASAFYKVPNLKTISIPNSVTSIDNSAFASCADLVDIKLPDSLVSIGDYSFYSCTGLTDITIPNSVITVGNGMFEGCTNLASIKLSDNLRLVGEYMFSNCSSLTNVTLPATVKSIRDGAFRYCSALQSINIPDAVRYIGDQAFYDCVSMQDLTLPDSVFYIGGSAFKRGSINSDEEIKVYTKRGTPTLLAYWQGGSEYLGYNEELAAYEIGTGVKLIAPTVTVEKVTSTAIRMKINNYYPEYRYCQNNNVLNVTDSVLTLTGLKPGTYYYCNSQSYKDVEEALIVRDDTVKFGMSFEFTTDDEISLTAQNPKVVSEGNAVVSAITNLDDAETNVGFEWRRTDWTDDFQSNEGKAYLFAGTMEGYIRRMNTNYMWKYRPFYESNSGTRYYGEWVGIDPTNTSYFEPSIHTYDNVTVDGNSVTLNGYVQCGSDNITSQGFAYWPNNGNGAKGLAKLTPIVPDDAQTITAKASSNSPIMKAELTGLAYNTEYSYVAFVTTSDGDTFYGEEQTFTTTGEATGIINVESGEVNAENVPTAIFDLNGRRLGQMQHGLNIVRYSNGTTKKILVK